MARNRMARRSFGFRSGPRRLTEWGARDFATDAIALAANTFVLDSVGNAAFLAALPLTIVRSVGLLSVSSDQNAAVETVIGSMGMLIASEKAVGLGAASLQDPVTDASSDSWFQYQAFAADGSASTNVGRRMYHFPFDSRAQRKVEEGSQLAILVANASATAGLEYVLNFRFLVKLH